jgi:hypothetical protein
MSPTVKYTLGRIGLFLAVVAALLPVRMHLLLKLMIAVLISAVLAFFLLRQWRDEMAESLASAAQRRKAEKERLRAALAGEDEPGSSPAPPAERP